MGNFFGTTNKLPKYRKIRVGQSWMPRTRDENPLLQFLDEDSSDVLIFVKNSPRSEDHLTWSRYPCHRALLRQHIPELERTIRLESVRFPSEQDPEVIIEVLRNVIYIDEHKPEIVEDVLRFIYREHLFMEDWKTAGEIMTMVSANQMDMPLVQRCEEFLKGSITLRNVCYLLTLSSVLDLPKLREKCKTVCNVAAFAILKTKAFSELPLCYVREITSSLDLNVKDEFSVFEALWNWSKHYCIRENLPLSEDDIVKNAFTYVSDYVGFWFMTDEQKTRKLPMAVQTKYAEQISRDLATLHLPPAALIVERRGFQLEPFLASNNHWFLNLSHPLLFKIVEPVSGSRGNQVSCIKFSLGVDTVLLGFVAVCLFSNGQNENPIEKLRVTGPRRTLLDWEHWGRGNNEENCNLAHERFLRQTDVRRRTIPLSLGNNVTVLEIHFLATAMLRLEAGTAYQLEIEPRELNVQWPKVLPQWHDSKFDSISIHSDSVCGLSKIIFLEPF